MKKKKIKLLNKILTNYNAIQFAMPRAGSCQQFNGSVRTFFETLRVCGLEFVADGSDSEIEIGLVPRNPHVAITKLFVCSNRVVHL